MFFDGGPFSYSVFQLRRADLCNYIKQAFPDFKEGAIILVGAFEHQRMRFTQESSFYYLTGVNEPAAVAIIYLDGTSKLFLPDYGQIRSAWVQEEISLNTKPKTIEFDQIVPLGKPLSGYQFYQLSERQHYQALISELEQIVKSGQKLFTLAPENAHEYIEQRWILNRFTSFIPELAQAFIDVSPLVAAMRRKKDMKEIETIYKAIEITVLAQAAAAQTIKNDFPESEVQASLEYIFTGSNARPAFNSIVAAGKNGTILHYINNNGIMKNGELVVVDIGAEYNHYCADLTRTYPVSGRFTKRQKELYQLVLQAQEYIEEQAKPGMWLYNKENTEKSLHHMAKRFFEERGYGQYFIHGIGHYLGLDVHDVSHNAPLAEGDVFTIEPGLYIPEEKIGIRIEDNYWLAKNGVICLSESLPKQSDEIEAFMTDNQSQEDTTDLFAQEIDFAQG